MKNRIIKTIGKLSGVIALAAILTGAGFAQKSVEKSGGEMRRRQATAQVRRQSNGRLAGEFSLSAVNQKNFNLGSEFIKALMDAAYLNENKNTAKSAIVALVYLIDCLENQPETAALQKILTSVVRAKANAAQVRLELQTASKSYSARLKNEQKWYFKAGGAVTNLVYSTFVDDDAAMKKDLSEIAELIKIAPAGISNKFIVSMNDLARFDARTAFAQDDYAAIFRGAVELVQAVNA